MTSRLTENTKRTRQALSLAHRCPACSWDPDDGWRFCGDHGCSAPTVTGRRCRNSATYPLLNRCSIHVTAGAIIGATDRESAR